jgi:polyvinyl alcohol dehydrogenase (cytochrome)
MTRKAIIALTGITVAVILACSTYSRAQGTAAIDGATLYQERCAKCHDHPSGRTPSKSAIADHTPAYLEAVMGEGIMRQMAQGLGWPQTAAIADYLATQKSGGVGTSAMEAPACSNKPPPLTLANPAWNGWGASPTQQRFQSDPGLSAAAVARLKLKWAMAFVGGRYGQATVVGGRVFVNSSSGAVYSLNAKTGCAYWRFDADAATRSTIIIGALPASMAPARFAAYFTDYSHSAYAIDAETGKLLWKTKVDDQPVALMTGSPVLDGGRLLVPISSFEEVIAQLDKYECCKFRGAIAALDAVSGKLLWKTYTTPTVAQPSRRNAKGVQMYGPAGAAVWSAPTVDAKRGLIYVGTGDSYTDVGFDTDDAILALDAKSGAIRWSAQLAKDDNYIDGCYGHKPPANCPATLGQDQDFGASPILHTLANGHQLILAGQKSSQLYALDPDDRGKIVWSHRLSPGGPLGGIEFSIAADQSNVYAPVADIYVGAKARPGLYAFRISDGQPLWSASSPAEACSWHNVYCDPSLSQAISAMPGVVFAGAMNGHFRAYDATNGKIIWEFDTAASDIKTVSGHLARGGVLDGAGPTIADGMVYVSTGYQGRSGTPESVLMAFSVDGK